MARPLRYPKDCCYRAVAADREATFCDECGQPLARCMAFAECGGLMGDDGLCTRCVDPHLQIIPGASMNAPIGGSVTLPFDLYNASGIDRPLFVTGLWSREKGDWRQERLGWETLDAGERAPASVTAQEFDRAGLHEVEIMWTVATRWKAREEQYAFSTRVLLTIPEAQAQASSVVQISSENEMNGNVIQITDNRSKAAADAGKVVSAIDMNIQRLDREERRLGLRGLSADLHIPRSATFVFTGFAPSQTPPPDVPLVSTDALLAFGRSRARGEGGEGDVRLLVHDAHGAIDEALSTTLSRRHFELYLENDRLVLRVTGANGLRVNDKAYGQDKTVLLADGDAIEPLLKAPDRLRLTLRFTRERDRVATVTLIRTPVQAEAA